MPNRVPTDEQKFAIEYPNNMVVIATPGSGKTYIVSKKIRTILPDLPSYRGIIAITYTNKAADELKKRCTAGGFDIKASVIGTIDKFCVGEIIIPFLPHIWGLPQKRPEIELLKEVSERYNDDLHIDIGANCCLKQLEINIDTIKQLYLSGTVILETLGALALYVMKHSKACLRYLKTKYSHIFIDEYQDSGYDQHQLFLEIVDHGVIGIAVGDEDQSIFRFSGKSPEHLLNLVKLPSFKLHRLTANLRSHISIVDYSSVLLNSSIKPTPNQDIRVFEVTTVGTTESISKWIDKQTTGIMERYKVEKLKDIGVLIRNGATGEIVDKSLQTPHRFFQSNILDEHFGLWSLLFSALIKYYYDISITVEQIISSLPFTYNDKLRRQLRSIIKQIRSMQPSCDEFIDHCVSIALLTLPNAKSDKSIELLRRVIFDASQLGSFYPAKDDEIQIMTLHKAKGLEFDIVFHLDLSEWVFPSKRPNSLPNGKPDWDDIVCEWDQELNLHYVGITRARKACYLCNSSQRINYSGTAVTAKPSEFLLLPELLPFRVKL